MAITTEVFVRTLPLCSHPGEYREISIVARAIISIDRSSYHGKVIRIGKRRLTIQTRKKIRGLSEGAVIRGSIDLDGAGYRVEFLAEVVKGASASRSRLIVGRFLYIEETHREQIEQLVDTPRSIRRDLASRSKES